MLFFASYTAWHVLTESVSGLAEDHFGTEPIYLSFGRFSLSIVSPSLNLTKTVIKQPFIRTLVQDFFTVQVSFALTRPIKYMCVFLPVVELAATRLYPTRSYRRLQCQFGRTCRASNSAWGSFTAKFVFRECTAIASNRLGMKISAC